MAAAVLAAILAALRLGAVAQAAPAVTAVYVFGDSSVDAGNYNLSPPLPRKTVPYYFRGRFSDSYNWADLITVALTGHYSYASGPFSPPYLPVDVRFQPRGTNYPYGGAVTGAGPDLPPPQVPSLGRQVEAFLKVDQPVPGSLVIISVGGNDFIANSLQRPSHRLSDGEVANRAASAITKVVRRLNAAGAHTFLVNVSNETGRTPQPGGFTAALIAQLDAAADQSPGLKVLKLDTSAVFTAVADHPAAFHITDAVRSCFTFNLLAPRLKALTFDPAAPRPTADAPTLYRRPGVCTDVAGHLLVDGLHDTSTVQGAIAHAALEALSGGSIASSGLFDTSP